MVARHLSKTVRQKAFWGVEDLCGHAGMWVCVHGGPPSSRLLRPLPCGGLKNLRGVLQAQV